MAVCWKYLVFCRSFWRQKKAGVKRCIVPEANEAEGALVKGIEIIGVKHLKQITKILSGERKKEKARNQSQKADGKKSAAGFF